MVKLQFDRNQQYKITLPKALIEAKGWKKGSELKVELDSEGNILLRLTRPVLAGEKEAHEKTK